MKINFNINKLILWFKSFYKRPPLKKETLSYKYKRGDRVYCGRDVGIIFSISNKMEDKSKPAYFIISESDDPLFYKDDYEDNLIPVHPAYINEGKNYDNTNP